MAEKQIYKYEKDSSLVYYQQNIDNTTKLSVGFVIPSGDLPNEHEHICRYKNVIVYMDDETGGIRIPIVKPGMLHLMEHFLSHSCKQFNERENFVKFRKTNTVYNASTSQYTMTIDLNCPSKYLEENLDIISKMLFRTDYHTDLKQEKSTVVHELEYVKDRDIPDIISALVDTEKNQTGVDILGIEKEVIDSITPNEMHRFARTHYTSQNLVMSVVSDLPFEDIKNLFDKYFVSKAPSIPESKVTPKLPEYFLGRDYMYVQPQPDKKTVTLDFFFKGSDNYEENEKMHYIEDYIFNDFNGRLMDKFRVENQLTYTPSFYDLPLSYNFVLKCFQIQTNQSGALRCLDVFTSMMRELAINGITEDELSSFKEYWEAHRLRKNNLKMRDPSNLLHTYLSGNEVFVKDMHEKVASITKEEFDSYFKKNYIDTNVIVLASGNTNGIEFPTIEEVTSFIRPYDNYAYETIYNEKGITEVYEYIDNLMANSPDGKIRLGEDDEFKFIKASKFYEEQSSLVKTNNDQNGENPAETFLNKINSKDKDTTKKDFYLVMPSANSKRMKLKVLEKDISVENEENQNK